MNGTIRHQLPSRMLERSWNVVVVGAGGTGSAVLPSLARLHHAMLELGHPGGIDCTVFDDDTVSPTNVGRQGFYPNDVGEYKASLIVNRLNALMGTNWRAETRRFGPGEPLYNVDLVIGCVDTRAARAAIVGAAQHTGAYYLDCGNDTDRGQVVIGQVCGKTYAQKHPERLPHVGELFPELIDAKLDAKDETPSCSMAEALRKQSLVINQAIAVQAFNMLWTMFRTGAVPFSGVFVNLATGRTNPIPLDPAAWARFGYEVPKPPVKKASKSRKAKLAA
ncbi:PRTRC system ThiF family protein [Caballeronia grimmiae]|uniref:PRTRC system ThiF family protein n=1 Tax=Caballeronia grimmiae TaxID=1071679 RepID=UPI0038BB2BA3